MKILKMNMKRMKTKMRKKILILALKWISKVILLHPQRFLIRLKKKRRNTKVKIFKKREKSLENIEPIFYKDTLISSKKKNLSWVFLIILGNSKDKNCIQDTCQSLQKLCTNKWIMLLKWLKIHMVIQHKILILQISESQFLFTYCWFMA